MQTYALVTWADQKMAAYETLTHRSLTEALAYSEGMITERKNPDRPNPAMPGVSYVIEIGHRDVDQTPAFISEIVIGVWHLGEAQGKTCLVWQQKRPDQTPTAPL